MIKITSCTFLKTWAEREERECVDFLPPPHSSKILPTLLPDQPSHSPRLAARANTRGNTKENTRKSTQEGTLYLVISGKNSRENTGQQIPSQSPSGWEHRRTQLFWGDFRDV